MTKTNIFIRAFLHSIIAVLYIALVSLIMNNSQELFGKQDTALSVMVFLLLFVFSAAIMGITVFGKPILLYLDGQKKEGITLGFCTIVCLGIFLLAGLFILSVVS
jgi:hypothetical protein